MFNKCSLHARCYGKHLINIIIFSPYKVPTTQMRRGKGLKEENVFLNHYASAELGSKPKHAHYRPVLFTFQNRFTSALPSRGLAADRHDQSTACFSLIPEAATISRSAHLLSAEQSWGIKSMCHPCYVNISHIARRKLYLMKATSIIQVINLWRTTGKILLHVRSLRNFSENY